MLEKLLSLFFELEIVGRMDEIYLMRWHIFKTRWGGLYLHKFLRGDEDDAPHCHPWDFRTFLLWSFYYDETHVVIDGKSVGFTLNKCRMFRMYSRKATHVHRVRITHGKPVWTLFWHGKKFRDWGFYDSRKGFVPQDIYLEDKKKPAMM